MKGFVESEPIKDYVKTLNVAVSVGGGVVVASVDAAAASGDAAAAASGEAAAASGDAVSASAAGDRDGMEVNDFMSAVDFGVAAECVREAVVSS